jgi:predicted amidophosphoribosyltransferase
MANPSDRTHEDSALVLLCPNCDKRLPLSGKLSMRGTTGIFCRHCRQTVQVSMDVVDGRIAGAEPQE